MTKNFLQISEIFYKTLRKTRFRLKVKQSWSDLSDVTLRGWQQIDTFFQSNI